MKAIQKRVPAQFGVASKAALILLLVLSTGGAVAQTSQNDGPGLRAPGTLSYDSEGVPTVVAQNDEDAAWLMGYAHAQLRFFQMDLLRRSASGTLAELVGPSKLAQDVQIRTLGLRRAAWASWAKLPPELSGQLKSYAAGVNAYLREAQSLPIEYGALELTSADPWTPVDSIVIGKLLAYQLSFDIDIDQTIRLGAYSQAGAAAGFNGAALFFEDTHRVAPPDDRITVPGFVPGSGAATVGAKDAKVLPQLSPTALDVAARWLDRIADNPWIAPLRQPREDRAGSNWWIVGGDHTASGRPILANDPHLQLDLPMLFLEGHVVSNDRRYPKALNSVGSIVPGTPMPILGCNEDVCWGLTTNPLDVTDTYFDTFVLNSYGLPTHSVHASGAEPVRWVFQSYYANRVGDGVADNVTVENSIGYLNGAVTVIVPRRNNGPMVSLDTASGEGITIQYAGWGPTRELEAFRRLNRATDLDAFADAVSYFDVGSQNFAYADRAGNIAYIASAEAPIREDLQAMTVTGLPPYFIRDGFAGNEWLPATQRYPNQALPYEVLGPDEMPQATNPASGYLANANNDPVGTTLDNNPFNQLRPGGGIYYLSPRYSALRMGRIDRELQSLIDRGDITTNDMRTLQANNALLDAELVMPYLLAAANGTANGDSCSALAVPAERMDTAVQLLTDWDFTTRTGIGPGFDPGDEPQSLVLPTLLEERNAAAATIFSVWRGQVIADTIDATLAGVGLGSQLPGGDDAYFALINLLERFDSRQGVGASGLDFFKASPGLNLAGSPAARRDCTLMGSLADGLALLASDAFAPAFAGSTDPATYQWGRLHRIVFDHPLGRAFSIPGNPVFPYRDLGEGLPGISRAGGYQAVDASSHNARADGVNEFMFGSGPVRRFIGEMTDPPRLVQIMPGGQGGDPTSFFFYANQLDRWLVNRYKPLVLDPDRSAQNSTRRFEFTPR